MTASVTRRSLARSAAGLGLSFVGACQLSSGCRAQANSKPTTYVVFQAGVNMQTINQLLRAMVQIQTDEVCLIISTSGGEVQAGILGYNFLRSLAKRLTTHNISNIDSIGNALFLAGEQRFASAHATFMFHGVGNQVQSGTVLSANNLSEFLGAMRADEKRIGNIIRERTKLTSEEISKFFQEAKTMDATEAMNEGLVSGIAELRVPVGASTIVVGP